MAFDSVPPASNIRTSRAFKEVAVDTAAVAGKYGFKTVHLAGGALGLVGAPLILGATVTKSGGHISEGRFVQAGMDLLPVLTEGYEVGLAGVAFSQALKQGAWQAAKAGGARLITGTSLAVGFGGGLFLTLAADLGQSALHERGFDVDNGFIATKQNQALNVNNAALALFPGDSPPFVKDVLTNNSSTMTQTGPYEWDLRSEFDIDSDSYTTEEVKPIVVTSHVNMSGVGNFLDKDLKYFSTFQGHYQFMDDKGKIHPDTQMNQIAKAMYENPDQAFGLFRDLLYKRTIDTALSLAKERHIKINGNGQELNNTDLLPPALMKEAADITKTNFQNSWTVAGNQYLEKGIAYLDAKFAKPENMNISKMETYRFLETFNNGQGGFRWDNPVHFAQLHAAVNQAIETYSPSGPKAQPAQTRGPTTQPLQTKLNAEQIHTVNQSVINQLVTGYLTDDQTNHFDHKKLSVLQNQLVQAGYLSGTHQTGTMNGFTVRAIDAAVKAELNPSSITEDQRAVIMEKADASFTGLRQTPADSSSFDPRVLSFQTNAYLLGLYDGRLDGLSGPKTGEALDKYEQLKQTGPALATALPSTPAVENTASVKTAPVIEPTTP